eukprot:3138715-Amphidinium_carterae.1
MRTYEILDVVQEAGQLRQPRNPARHFSDFTVITGSSTGVSKGTPLQKICTKGLVFGCHELVSTPLVALNVCKAATRGSGGSTCPFEAQCVPKNSQEADKTGQLHDAHNSKVVHRAQPRPTCVAQAAVCSWHD